MKEVSIVITCYNYGKYLEQAVYSAMHQDMPVEVIVIDDGSNDEFTLEVLQKVEKIGVYVYRQPNMGLPGARNCGIRLVRSKYIVCLDADDLLSRQYCSTCLNAIKSNKNIGFVYTTTRVFGQKTRIWSNLSFSKLHLLVDNYIPYSAMFYRDLWEDVGGYDENMRFGYEDWDFWLSAIKKGWKGLHIPKELFWYRKHGKSMLSNSNRRRKEIKSYLHHKHYDLYSKKEIYKLIKEEPLKIPRMLRCLIIKEVLRQVILRVNK